MSTPKYVIKQILKEPRNQEIWSRRAYVDWVNETLGANFTNTLEFRNGAAYIQLTDMLFPGVMPIDEIKFCAETQYDCYKNFRVLEQIFKKLGIMKAFDTDALSSGRHVESWAFLKWFKAFFDLNFKIKAYDPLKARNYAYMGFGRRNCTEKFATALKLAKAHRAKALKHKQKLVPVKSKSVIGLNALNDRTNLNKKNCLSVECLVADKIPNSARSSNSPSVQEKLADQNSSDCLENEKEPSFQDLELTSAANIKLPHQNVDIGLKSVTSLHLLNEGGSCKKGNCSLAESKKSSTNGNLKLIINDKKFDSFPTETSTDINFELQLNNDKAVKNYVSNTNEISAILGRALSFKAKNSSSTNSEEDASDGSQSRNIVVGESNIKSIVVNTTQQYEDYGVRVTENLQLKIERSNSEQEDGANETPENKDNQKKINLMIEKLLRYHWTERREYFQTIADFLKEENEKAQRKV